MRQRVITQSGMPTHAALIFRAISTFATTKSCMTTCLFRSGTAALRRTRARERTRDKGSSESLRSRAFQICVLPHRRRRKIYWSEQKGNLSETAMMAKVLSSVSGYPLCRKEEKRGSEAFANGSAHSIADLHLKSLSGPKSLPPWRISTFSTTDLKKC